MTIYIEKDTEILGKDFFDELGDIELESRLSVISNRFSINISDRDLLIAKLKESTYVDLIDEGLKFHGTVLLDQVKDLEVKSYEELCLL